MVEWNVNDDFAAVYWDSRVGARRYFDEVSNRIGMAYDPDESEDLRNELEAADNDVERALISHFDDGGNATAFETDEMGTRSVLIGHFNDSERMAVAQAYGDDTPGVPWVVVEYDEDGNQEARFHEYESHAYDDFREVTDTFAPERSAEARDLAERVESASRDVSLAEYLYEGASENSLEDSYEGDYETVLLGRLSEDEIAVLDEDGATAWEWAVVSWNDEGDYSASYFRDPAEAATLYRRIEARIEDSEAERRQEDGDPEGLRELIRNVGTDEGLGAYLRETRSGHWTYNQSSNSDGEGVLISALNAEERDVLSDNGGDSGFWAVVEWDSDGEHEAVFFDSESDAGNLFRATSERLTPPPEPEAAPSEAEEFLARAGVYQTVQQRPNQIWEDTTAGRTSPQRSRPTTGSRPRPPAAASPTS